jgi:hypothetical protein
VERYVSTANDLLLSGKTERNIECCWQLGIDPCAPGGNALLVAATALRATNYRYLLPSRSIDPYAVFGLDPAVPTARVIESYYRQASELLNRCHPRDPCSPAFTEAARLIAHAWAFQSDPDSKAALDFAYEAFEVAETAAAPVPTTPCRLEEMPKRPIGQKPTKKAALAAKRQSKRPRSDDDDDGNSKESAIDLDKLDKFQEETNANRIKVLELQQKLSSEKFETTKLAHLTAQETKEGKKLILEAKKVEKESKMMDAYNNLISQDTSSISDEEKAERVVTMKCLRKAFFHETI